MRYDWIDFARGFLMIMVFIYHSEVYYYNEHTYSWMFVPFFLTGFFFVSGFLFTRNLNSVDFYSKVKQVFRGIVTPYLIFETLITFPKIVIGRVDSVQAIIDIILFRGSWFIIAVGVMQILYAFVLARWSTMKRLFIWSSVFFVLGLVLCSIYYPSSPFRETIVNNKILYSSDLPSRLPLCLNLALLNCPYFALGIYCRRHEFKLQELCKSKYLLHSTLLFVVLYIVVDHLYIGSYWNGASGTYHNLPLMILYSILGIWMVLCFSSSIKNIGIVNYIGRYSILFALMNGGGLVTASLIINKFGSFEPSNYWCQLLVALISIFVVYLASLLINRFIPIIRGDKASFNYWSKKFGLNIKW